MTAAPERGGNSGREGTEIVRRIWRSIVILWKDHSIRTGWRKSGGNGSSEGTEIVHQIRRIIGSSVWSSVGIASVVMQCRRQCFASLIMT